jgi:glutamate racemase
MMRVTGSSQPIGVFDSGVGGLSVLRHLHEAAPQERLLYFADQAHVPYGARTAAEIRAYSAEITRFLLGQGAKIIVVACNTATAAALNSLRQGFPDVSFVGMEPAVKPAAGSTRSGVVGVLATPGTFASPRYASLMARFAGDVTVLEDPCVGLVPLIEAGDLDGAATAELLRSVLQPMLAQGVDTLVLGCTHYPFVQPLLAEIVAQEAPGREVRIIDPAPAVARQALRVLEEQGLLAPPSQQGQTYGFTSAQPAPLAALGERLLGWELDVTAVRWYGGVLTSA